MFNKVQLSHGGGVFAAMGLACLMGLSASPASGALITTADGQGADANVRLEAVNGNYGTAAFVAIYGGGSSKTYKTYLRFDLASQSLDAAAVTLQLTYQAYGTGNVSIYGLKDGTAGDAAPTSTGWKENAITWNNAPANDTGSINGFTSDAIFLMSAYESGETAGTTDTFSSTALTDFINDDTNGLVTFLLSATSASDSRRWDTKETITDAYTPHPPALNITSVPEPGAAAIAGIGLAGWLLKRRRNLRMNPNV
jgi:hypothetical protein